MNVTSQKRARGRPRIDGVRERILDAALELFAERGFHGAAVPEIAARAGIAVASLYRHFTGKEALVNELYRQWKQALVDALLPALPASSDLRGPFHQLWWRLVRFAREQPLAFAFLELHHHGSYLDAESRAIEMRVLLPIAAVLDAGRAAGLTKPMPPGPLIVTVWGAFVGMIRAARLGYLELTDELCAQVEATCWDAIAGQSQTALLI